MKVSSTSTLERHAINGMHGANWYKEAAPLLQRRADKLWVPLSQYCDIMALTSPRVRVRRNVEFTEAFLTDGFRGLVKLRCMETVMLPVRRYLETGKINGPKTSAFALALKGDEDAIVLDVWMARALGVPEGSVNTKQVRNKALPRIRAVARELNITPAQAQAAIWTGVYTGQAPSLAEILDAMGEP